MRAVAASRTQMPSLEFAGRNISTRQIEEKIWLAIAERRLCPGVQLKEGQLSGIFNVSRARIRQVLSALQRDGLVRIIPNRGAFVARPSTQEAQDVFGVRRMVEQRVVERVVEHASGADLERLRRHVGIEREAIDHAATTEIIRQSGGFHLLLAEITQSAFLTGAMRDLVTRSSLITAIYRKTDCRNCGPDEHESLVEAITRRDREKAMALMIHHLEHLEAELDLAVTPPASDDLRRALA
ncbi:GntR family transcriptional regulator [Mesorhizobium sp. L-8-10]|nr:GntR family transcriptional regulator [Mesorhizobium sp. L-8-10]